MFEIPKSVLQTYLIETNQASQVLLLDSFQCYEKKKLEKIQLYETVHFKGTF